MKNNILVLTMLMLIVLSGCSTTGSGIYANPATLPKYDNAAGSSATISFSDDSIFETEDGIPKSGESIICTAGKMYSANDANGQRRTLTVEDEKEIAVTTIVRLSSAGHGADCSDYVAFKPQANTKYVVVGEQIGGKGISALWTGVGLMSCLVSVYKENNDGSYDKVVTRKATKDMCVSAKQK